MKDLTVKQLRDLAKKYNVKGRWDMNKQQLIEHIENAQKDMPNEREEKLRRKMNIETGFLVAFRIGADKVRSAKVIENDKENRVLKAVTEYGREFEIKYSEVLWVKTGKRWPKGVYELLKGGSVHGQRECGN